MRPTLLREICLVLALKIAALTALYIVCFSPAHRPVSGAAATQAQIFGESRVAR